MILTKRTLLATLAAATLALSAPLAAAQERLSVTATTGMIADAARAVGGDLVEVRALMGPGVDPHSYRQTRTDIAALASADLVLWHGLYLEAQMEEFLLDLAGRGHVVAVGETLPSAALIAHDDYPDKVDPHVWMDPSLWKGVVTAIHDAMIGVAPEHAETFGANADAYLADLDALATYARDVLATVPPAARVLLTSHDAFNYFGAAYDFEVIGIQGISTESEAGLRRISELVDLIIARDLRAVFVETSVSDRNIRALI